MRVHKWYVNDAPANSNLKMQSSIVLHQDLHVRLFVLCIWKLVSISPAQLGYTIKEIRAYMQQFLETAVDQVVELDLCCAHIVRLNPAFGNSLDDVDKVLLGIS